MDKDGGVKSDNEEDDAVISGAKTVRFPKSDTKFVNLLLK